MKIEDALQEFLLAGRANLLRPATLKWYSSLLNAFVEEFSATELPSITTANIRHYIVGLREKDSRYIDAPQKPKQQGGLSDASIKGHITALHSFWSWCAEEYSIPNPMIHIKRPKRSKGQPRAIEAGDFVKLIKQYQ